jgi:anti-sigma factor RsiW
MDHPSDAAIEGYTDGTLEPSELLAVDDHLAACEACRGRAVAFARRARPVPDLPMEMLPVDSHLTDTQVAALVDGTLDASETAAAGAHLRACTPCAEEVEALRTWARGKSGARRIPYALAAAAAAAFLAFLVPAALRWQAEARTPPSLAGLERLPAAERERVQQALDRGAAVPPARVARLGSASEVLMGSAPRESFRLVAPLATAVVSDRPEFRWEPLTGADAYTVSVFDEALHPVAESGPVAGTSWSPGKAIPRGRVYVWQVTAYRGPQPVSAPAPPAPLAKFEVVDETTARLLDETARAHPDAHLLLGILYAQAGARNDAIAQLAQVSGTDPHVEVARRTVSVLGAPVREK